MPLGPGKYDDLCTYVREKAEALGVVIVVLRGNQGDGFAMQATAAATLDAPRMLHYLADQIRATHPELIEQLKKEAGHEYADGQADQGSGEGPGVPGSDPGGQG
jgi:hypothetical protein